MANAMGFKNGDLAVIVQSNVGNVGRMVRIIDADHEIEEGTTFDVLVEACNPEEGLNYIAHLEDGEMELQCTQMSLTSTKLVGISRETK